MSPIRVACFLLCVTAIWEEPSIRTGRAAFYLAAAGTSIRMVLTSVIRGKLPSTVQDENTMTMPTDTTALVLEQLADALIIADVDGRIAGWNRAASDLFGYGADEALGQSLDLIIPERLRAAHWRGYQAAIESGKTRLSGKPTLTKAIHKDGRKLFVEMTFAVVGDAQGKSVGSVAVARDVTERVERERAQAA